MRYSTFVFSVFAVFCIPFFVHAHASPIDYQPQSSEQLSEAPSEVKIRFSERIEPGASRITVEDENGVRMDDGEAKVDPVDAHFLSVPLKQFEKGTVFVNWSVVSSDDGHFTKGGYAYFVGVAATGTAQSVPQVQIVQLSATPEASAMFVELLGNSFLWGALIFFALILRPLFSTVNTLQKQVISRSFYIIIALGIALVLIGGGVHVVLKTRELATLHSISIREALPLYLATVSGAATIYRAVAAICFAVIFFFSRNRILAATKITWNEVLLFMALAAFAYLRSKVSHATANPFYPELSVAINFFHLIGKGLWEGLIGGLSLVYLSKTLRPLMPQMLPRAFALLSIAFGIVGASASYIVWLHLKDFSNITSTLWGERFIPLAASAILAVALLVYHVVLNRYRPEFVGRYLRYTLPAEFAVGVLVVFFSSLMIITSPPIEATHAKNFEAENNGLAIKLGKAPFEDGKALITLSGGKEGAYKDPTVMIGEGEGGLIVDLERRFNGGYVFPASLIAPGSPHKVVITAPQESSYDSQATFDVMRTDLEPEPTKGHGRTFDLFTLTMLLFGAGNVVMAALVYRLSHAQFDEPSRSNSVVRYGIGLIGGFIVASQFIGIGIYAFSNEYKKQCVADGNGWHIMLPTKNAIPVSSVPQEGCMALNGSFHLPDVREYQFFKTQGESNVEFATDLEAFKAGQPTSFDFSIKDKEGKPAILSVQHERLVHFIVISKDMREFHHIHPDDMAPLTADAMKNASFKIPFTFPKSGEYILAIDYAHGLALESKKFVVNVSGTPAQEQDMAAYPEEGVFEGYTVSIDYIQPFAGEFSNLIYRISKDGKDITTLSPYLGAAMHVAVVKDDLSEFLHTHGEVHIPGAPVKPLSTTNVHNHAPPPARFGPMVEAHPIFPTPGMYTVFGQFMHEGKVITSRFTVRVE